jgi:hypothetical protein
MGLAAAAKQKLQKTKENAEERDERKHSTGKQRKSRELTKGTGAILEHQKKREEKTILGLSPITHFTQGPSPIYLCTHQGPSPIAKPNPYWAPEISKAHFV